MAIEQLTRFERAVFRVAAAFAVLLVLVRLLAAIAAWHLHHAR